LDADVDEGAPADDDDPLFIVCVVELGDARPAEDEGAAEAAAAAAKAVEFIRSAMPPCWPGREESGRFFATGC
jgi:hypothetical protein